MGRKKPGRICSFTGKIASILATTFMTKDYFKRRLFAKFSHNIPVSIGAQKGWRIETAFSRLNRPVVHKEALVRMLRALGGDGNVEDTAGILEEMNVKEEDEITMCELFDQYTRRGRKEGLSEGRKEGLSEGRKEGLSEGRKEGLSEGRKQGIKEGRLEGIISTCRELGVSFDETVAKVKEKFSLGEEEARKNMQLYW